jgi:hypothetical protein
MLPNPLVYRAVRCGSPAGGNALRTLTDINDKPANYSQSVASVLLEYSIIFVKH